MYESGKPPMSVGRIIDSLLEQDVDPSQIDFGESPGEEAAMFADQIAVLVGDDDGLHNELWDLRTQLEMTIDEIDDLDVSGLIIAGIQTQWRDADALFDEAVRAHRRLAERLRGLRSGTG